jgi:hypothetical protein
VTSSAVGFQLGCISWDADPHKLAMVEYHCGHDPGNVTLRPGDIPMSADLARDVGVGIKLNIKVDRPTALFPEWVVQSQRARRAIIGRTRSLLALAAKSASPTMTAVTSSDLNRQCLEKS